MKDPTYMCWAKSSQLLAVGTAKGNLLIYNHRTTKKVPIMGKHSKKIISGAWNIDNKLALGSADRQLTVSNENGDTLEQIALKSDPMNVCFSEQKIDERDNARENTVSININKNSLLLHNIGKNEMPVELAFQAKYGDINSFHWFGDGYIMIGFSKGNVVAVSTHMKEIGEEIHSIKLHESSLTNLAYSPEVS
jgi:WD repeat-containing protein 19